jgi:hypothetical protein
MDYHGVFARVCNYVTRHWETQRAVRLPQGIRRFRPRLYYNLPVLRPGQQYLCACCLARATGGGRSGLHALGNTNHRGSLRRRARSRGQLVRQYLLDWSNDRAHIRRPLRLLLDLARRLFGQRANRRGGCRAGFVLRPARSITAGASPPRMDAIGMVLLASGLLSGMLAVSYLAGRNAHAGSLEFVVPLAIAILALWLFFRHINHAAYPLIAPRLISGSGFGTVNLINTVYGGVTAGVVALIPLYARNRYGINALNSGTLLIAQGAAAIILSIAAAFALRRTGYRAPLYFGGVVTATGMLLLALSPVIGIAPYAWLAGSASLMGIGRGANNPASRNAGLQLAPEHSSTLAALRTICLQIGTIITISIDTAILASSHDPGRTQAWLFVAAAAVLVTALPLITIVPEHQGSW